MDSQESYRRELAMRIIDLRYPDFFREEVQFSLPVGDNGVTGPTSPEFETCFQLLTQHLSKEYGPKKLSTYAWYLWAFPEDRVLAQERLSELLGATNPEEGPREIVRHYLASAFDQWEALSEMAYPDLMREYRVALSRQNELTKQHNHEADLYRFFSEPQSDADYGHWLMRDAWTVEQAVLLSLGKDPDIVSGETLASAVRSPTESAFYQDFLNRIALLTSAVAAGLTKDPVNPSWFVKWATAKRLECPAQLTGLLDGDRAVEATKGKHRTSDATFRKLILGMAVSHYGFDPNYDPKQGSQAFSRIVEDLEEASISTNVQTVKDVLVTSLDWSKDHLTKRIKVPKETWDRRGRGRGR